MKHTYQEIKTSEINWQLYKLCLWGLCRRLCKESPDKGAEDEAEDGVAVHNPEKHNKTCVVTVEHNYNFFKPQKK